MPSPVPRAPSSSAPRDPRTLDARVAVIIVTWNRRTMVSDVLAALSRQTAGPGCMDVIVVDNHSTDGTLERLVERWSPDRIVDNPTTRPDRPAFAPRDGVRGPNLAGFRSLTIVRNGDNLGGCGGFNTGFRYIAHALDTPAARAAGTAPDYAWLVDDDIDLEPTTLERLASTMRSDPSIGLVGSRTKDINRRGTTIETTIYFDPATGFMGDHPAPHHRLAASHGEWAARVGGPKGDHEFQGVRDVDIVSACSMLARWSAVREVGFWDDRYFIYCDDADWCLRFAHAGYRIVCDLDAVIYHTPWHHKLTPARLYYAQRNILWVIQKSVPLPRMRSVLRERVASLLKDALHAALHRRLFHAEIIRRSVHDAVVGVHGKLDDQGPKAEPVAAALTRLGLADPDASIAVVCCVPGSLDWSRELREAAEAAGLRVGRWIEIVRNDVPGHDHPAPPGVKRVVYSHRRRSRLRRQLGFVMSPPRAVVIFDQTNDFPLLTAGWNLHIDRKSPSMVQVEEDGLASRLEFLTRLLRTRSLARRWCAEAEPPASSSLRPAAAPGTPIA